MAEQYVNIRRVIDSIMQHPLLQDITFEQVVDMTVAFMRLVGVPEMFVEKTAVLEVSKYRAALPCDYYQMVQVRSNGDALRYTTDSFHMSDEKNSFKTDKTYKVQGNIIYTSFAEGALEIAYRAIALDSEGYPLLPDNSSFLRALELYIKKQWFTVLFDLGKIQGAVLQNTKQEYAWAVGDCHCEFHRMSIDKAESFFNSWKSLIMKDSHRNGFIEDGRQEYIKAH